jgi:hypothetical protein
MTRALQRRLRATLLSIQQVVAKRNQRQRHLRAVPRSGCRGSRPCSRDRLRWHQSAGLQRGKAGLGHILQRAVEPLPKR